MHVTSCRAFLAAALAVRVATPCAGAQTTNCVQPTAQQLIVYHAGSLSAAFTPIELAFTCQTGVQVQDMTDNFLKPAGAANYDIVFAHGRRRRRQQEG